MWGFVQAYGKELVSLTVPLIAWALNTFLKPAVKLVTASPHQFTFLINQPLLGEDGKQLRDSQNVFTRSLILLNEGREVATKVEVVFNWRPQYLNVWPSRHYAEYTEPDKRYVIVMDSLAPKEIFGCELLSINADLPAVLTVRCDQSVAQAVNMYPQPVMATWMRRAWKFFGLVGLAAVLYLLIVIIQWLVLQTPLGR